MNYEIWLDFVNYRQYTGNIERELTDFIFDSEWDGAHWEVPEKWEDRLVAFPHDEYGSVLCDIDGKVYSAEEVKKYGLEGESYEGAPENYHCFRIFWRFSLASDREAEDMAKFLVGKSQDFMCDMQARDARYKKEIPTEIYRLERIEVMR